MKKLIIVLALMLVSLSAAGCGNSSQPTDDSSKDAGNGTEAAAGEFESEDIKLINGLYDEEDLELINSIQGNITHIDNGGTFPVLVANDKVYTEDYGTLKEFVSLNAAPDSILYFDNVEIGQNIFCFKDGKISLYPFNEYGISFADIDFNEENDFVSEIGLSSFYKIAHYDGKNYIIDDYEDMDGSGEIEFYGQDPVEGYETADYNPLNAAKVIPLKSNMYGYCVYVITDNGDLYWADTESVAQGQMPMMTSSPIASGVENVLAPSDVGNKLTAPIYSKTGDTSALYSSAPGADIIDTSDNFEISFVLPDGHTTDEVKDIMQVSDKLVFIFDNGDTYYTGDIQDEEKTSYEMTKLDEISSLNSEGSVLDMAGAATMDDNIYLLLKDGKLYYKELS